MSCKKYKKMIQNSLSGKLSPAEQEALHTHIAECSECHALYTIHTALDKISLTPPVPEKEEFAHMRRQVLAKIRSAKQLKMQIDFSALWQSIRTNAWRPAVAFSLVLGFLLGRIMPTEDSNLGERIIESVSLLASQSKTLFSEDKSGYSYSNVTFKESSPDEIQMSFDVSTHVDVVRDKQDPLVKEIMAQTLLSPGNTGTRLKAISSMEHLPDLKYKQSLIHAFQNDPSPAVRMAAINKLRQFPKDQEIALAMKDVIKNEENFKMRRDALEYLKKAEMDPDSLKSIIRSLDIQKSRPIIIKAEKSFKTKKERE
jgi:hypothetical protein